MAFHVPKAPGMAQMLKEGARYFSGLEEAVYGNISACKQFAQTVRTAYGPNGMNKMIINHIEKLFITNDAATIINELEVEHPAAKLIVLASKMQEAEVGDGTNFVIIFAGALLEAAEELLRLGITTSEIVEGYEASLEKVLQILPTLVCYEIKDYKDEKQIKMGIKTAIMSKQYGNEEPLTSLVAQACISILPKKSTFNVDNVRVCKILGSGISSSEVVQGMVFKRQVEGDVTKKDNSKIAVYTCAVDIIQTETKGTVLIKTADELMKFSRGEESLLESQIKAIADSGASVIVSGGKFGDMALHYMNKYNLMAVRIPSKFDIRRLCKTVGATALSKLAPPSKEELGYADSVYIDEVGDTIVVKFAINGKDSRVSTIIVRGSTENYMDDIERAIDDGVNTFKGITRDGRFVPGAGATEIELASQLSTYADTLPGLEQYAVRRFATALEVFPKTLAENSGSYASELLSKLYSAHKEGKKNYGFNIDQKGGLIDTVESGILDLFLTKQWGLKYAVGVACTVLKVNQIIMAKRAGGPKVPGGGIRDDDEYKLAKEAGFKAVESGFPFGFSIEDVSKAKKNADIEQVLINVYTGDISKGELGFAAIPGEEENFKKSIDLTIEYANALNCKRIHVMSGKVNQITTINDDIYIKNLLYAVEKFQKEGIIALIEPINNITVPNYYMNSFEKGLDVIKKINKSNLKLQLDIFHLQHICGNITKNIKELLPYIGHIQIAQVPDRHEPDTFGEIDYKYVLSLLETEGYNEYIGLEYYPISSSINGLNWIQKYGYKL